MIMSQSSSSMSSAFNGEWINAAQHGASGSEFQATGAIAAGSNEITLKDPGDFTVGQEVTISGCHRHYYGTVYNEKEPYFARNQSLLKDEIELRGLNANKSWQTFVLDFYKTEPITFRWLAVDPAYQTLVTTHPVVNRYWRWQGESLPVNTDWIPLADGVEMRFNKRDWLPGQSIAFHARNRLLAKITGIRGKTLILSEQATLDAPEAAVRHHDQAALQSALDRAITERKGLFIPAGRYRLDKGLWIQNASVRIEGAQRDLVTLDISEDHTAVFWISGGREVIVRNLGMVGHTGFMELPSPSFSTATGYAYWPLANQQMEIKGCAAANFAGTEHLLFEDLKVSRMASEVFYSHGGDRYGSEPYIQAPHEGRPEILKQYTKSCVYHRCQVSDCNMTAFNNNDFAEGTSILHCHVERTSNLCENASRFTRVIGNYMKDGCSFSVHAGSAADPHRIGTTQAIVADNVFEGGILLGGIGIANNATQVIVANNLFIGFSKESAIFVLGGRRIIITGNHIDLTRIEDNPDNERCGICIEASNVLVADNHIYVRGPDSDKVTGIHVADDAVNINIHDNLVENCHWGFRTGRREYLPQGEPGRFAFLKGHFEFRHTEAEVVTPLGERAFSEKALPFRCDDSAPYSGWYLRWLTGSGAGQTMTIASYSSRERRVSLKESFAPQAGDRFAVYPRYANWQVHHNTAAGCACPMALDLPGAENVSIRDNIISPPDSAG